MKRGGQLWGRSKDAYFRRLLGSEAGLGMEAVERLLKRLRSEVARVELREAGRRGMTGGPVQQPPEADANATTGDADPLPPAEPFDPYSPNVIVVVRTRGRDAALAELADISSADDLRLLAREQQLSIDAGLRSAEEVRLAIVEAADRRIANRRAAAG
jgi:hypothetical protein